jgi:hypothetical protein
VLQVGGHGSCRWLRDGKAHFRTVKARHGRCDPSPVWLRAKGTARWAHTFRRKLPPGRYVAYSRAFDTAGLRQFGAPSRRAFRVR